MLSAHLLGELVHWCFLYLLFKFLSRQVARLPEQDSPAEHFMIRYHTISGSDVYFSLAMWPHVGRSHDSRTSKMAGRSYPMSLFRKAIEIKMEEPMLNRDDGYDLTASLTFCYVYKYDSLFWLWQNWWQNKDCNKLCN